MPRPRLVPSVLLCAALWTAPAAAQATATRAPAPPAEPAGDAAVAPVVIDGRTLFNLRGVSAYPADRRAREFEERLRAFAADPGVDPATFTLEDRANATVILAGSRLVLMVLDEDAAVETVERRLLSQVYLTRIREAIVEYRAARQPARLARHALYALGATLVLILAAYLGRRCVRWLRAGLERRYRARVENVQEQAFQLVKAEQIWRLLTGLLNLGWAFGVLAMVYAYLRYVLTLFPWTRGLGNGLLDLVVGPVTAMWTSTVAAIPGLVFLALLFVVTRFGLKLIRLFFDGVANGTVTLQNFDPDWAAPTYRLVRVFVVAFAIVVAYPYIPGSSSDAFKGVSLFIGVIFSLGSSSLIGNLIAGYSMTYRRAFRLGDRVKIGNHVGEVVRMRLLVTHLRTPKNEEIIVPNSAILGAEVVNFSSMAKELGLILHTTVGIGYETPWRQVEALLLEAAARTPGLLRQPPPFVLHRALGDFCVTYEINVYCDAPHAMNQLYTDLHRNILDVFNEYGVQIMTPAYEADPLQPKVVPKDQWYAAPAQPRDPLAGGTRPAADQAVEVTSR